MHKNVRIILAIVISGIFTIGIGLIGLFLTLMLSFAGDNQNEEVLRSYLLISNLIIFLVDLVFNISFLSFFLKGVVDGTMRIVLTVAISVASLLLLSLFFVI